jgi:hypothetical protein
MPITITAKYPKAEVRRLVVFAVKHVGVDLKTVQINVKGSQYAYAGRAYGGIPSLSPAWGTGASYLVVIRIGTPDCFPITTAQSKRCPLITMNTWQEALLAVCAHELQHVVQFRDRLAKSEVQREHVANAVLDLWRRRRRKAKTA